MSDDIRTEYRAALLARIAAAEAAKDSYDEAFRMADLRAGLLAMLVAADNEDLRIADIAHVQAHRDAYEKYVTRLAVATERQAAAWERIAAALERLAAK